MGWSLNIGSIAGTAVRIHITFLLFLGWIFGAAYVSGGAASAWTGLIFILLVNPGQLQPLVDTTIGRVSIAAAITGVIAGFYAIRKIVSIEL